MKTVVFAFLLGCSHWSIADKTLETAYATEEIIDWKQSGRILKECNEDNPIIGKCGQRTPLIVYIPVTIVLHALVTDLLPDEWRTWWQIISLDAEMYSISLNYERGYP